MTRSIPILLFLSLLLSACRKADTMFCNLPANFTMEHIYQAPVLYTACNSTGEFCSVTSKGKTFEFSNTKNTSTVNRTAMNDYAGFYLGLSGFIVGLPTIPELGQDVSHVVCFDLACSNCYHDNGVTKRLVLQEGGNATCSTCHRTYNLNNVGIISKGEGGKPLYRYRVNLIGNTLIIANR